MANFPRASRADIILFVVAAFGFTWAFWVPMALIAHGWQAPSWLVWVIDSPLNIAAFGPTFAAVLVIGRKGRAAGAVRFIWQGLTCKFRPWLLLPALGLFPLITGLAVVIGQGAEAAFAPRSEPGTIIAGLVSFAAITLNAGPLQEEFGWRGFLMPALQGRMSGLAAAVLVGVIWALWHFPLNFEAGGRGPQYSEALPILIGSIVTITLVSVMIGWLYNASGGSVLLAILMHGSLNFSTFVLFPVFENPTSLATYTGLILLAALVLTVLGGPRALGRRS